MAQGVASGRCAMYLFLSFLKQLHPHKKLQNNAARSPEPNSQLHPVVTS